MSTSAVGSPLVADTAETVVRFHLSLNVSDLAYAQAFYRVLLGCEPAKAREDYVKFELDQPPLVLSLIPAAHAGGGPLNHVGMRLTGAEELVAVQARLESAGYRTQREEGVACCYSRQTKFWVADPDRTLWELYLLHDEPVDDDVDHQKAQASADAQACCEAPSSLSQSTLVNLQPSLPAESTRQRSEHKTAAPVIWLHNLLAPLPERLEQADDSVDEAQLQGTLNVPHEPNRLMHFLAEVRRVLRPGGRVLVHGLVADRPLAAAPDLPGPAALVSHVPVESWPAEVLASAGFVNVEISKLGAAPCFSCAGAELREFKVVARKPAAAPSGVAATVIYRGPLRSVTDDRGQIFTRGQRVVVGPDTLAELKAGPLAAQFTVLDNRSDDRGCGR